MADKVLFIINKYSGKGYEASVEGEVVHACRRFGVEGTMEYTREKGHATELARQAMKAGYRRGAAGVVGFLFQPAPRRNVNLAADDGLDAFLARGLIKLNRPVHCAVVGDGERGEFQFMRLVHQPVQTARAIEQ